MVIVIRDTNTIDNDNDGIQNNNAGQCGLSAGDQVLRVTKSHHEAGEQVEKTSSGGKEEIVDL